MRNILSLVLIFLLGLTLVSCSGNHQAKEISCEDIIKAYEDAGYYVVHGEHKAETDNEWLCYIKVSISEDDNSDYIYFTTCFTEKQAEKLAKEQKYNLVIWFYGAICGESRWLKSESYGTIHFSYYNEELVKPFNKLIAEISS